MMGQMKPIFSLSLLISSTCCLHSLPFSPPQFSSFSPRHLYFPLSIYPDFHVKDNLFFSLPPNVTCRMRNMLARRFKCEGKTPYETINCVTSHYKNRRHLNGSGERTIRILSCRCDAAILRSDWSIF